MNKMQMAHDYFMKHENTEQYRFVSVEELASVAWKYADAMQAEAEKREKELKHNHLKTYAEAYMNCEIQVVDPDGNCRITTRQKELDRKEWQPDWSQAPDGVTGWSMRSDGNAIWHYYYGTSVILAPSFGYTGDWRESQRRRPQ